MSVNSSSSHLYTCLDSRAGLIISVAYSVTKNILILPLSTFVLYLGHQRWRRQRSFATTSHSDIFTYNMAAVELICAFGGIAFFCGVYTGLSELVRVELYAYFMVFPGEMFFHILTCVERYLAVVHPVTYMGLRQSGGVKIRNISIVCVWLLSFGWSGVAGGIDLPYIPIFCALVVASVVVSFCSLSVLRVLIRPGPGEVGGDRERVDQSKQRAFHTITTIMGVLWLWFAGFLVCLALKYSNLLNYNDTCRVLLSGFWFSLPSSLVLPLLFLHRAGKLPRCH